MAIDARDIAPQAEEVTEPQWYGRFPGQPGWYWCYQALPKDYGENIFIMWVDSSMTLPGNIEACYGPIIPPEVPEQFVPDRYRKEKETAE